MIRTLLFLLFVLNPALAMEQKQQDKLNNILINAIKNNRYRDVRTAIKAGADATAYFQTWEKWSMLHLAVDYASTKICTLLIKNGASPLAQDRHQRTPLHHAAIKCRYRTCALLIAHGANPDAADDVGTTPLSSALSSDDLHAGMRKYRSREENERQESKLIKTCQILLEHGADVNTTFSTVYYTGPILSYAAETSDNLLKLMLSYNPSTETGDIYASLMRAARKNQSRRCRLIVDYLTHFKPTIFTTLLCLNRMRKTCIISGELYRHFRVLLLPHLDHQLPPLSILAERAKCYDYIESLKGPHKELAPKTVSSSGSSSSWCCIQ